MIHIGQIEADPPGIDKEKWPAFISSHPSLRTNPGTPRVGINPFTRKPHEFKPRPTTVIVDAGGEEIGSIYWAMDGSPMLIVSAEEGSADAVVPIAEQIAGALRGRFVREPDSG